MYLYENKANAGYGSQKHILEKAYQGGGIEIHHLPFFSTTTPIHNRGNFTCPTFADQLTPGVSKLSPHKSIDYTCLALWAVWSLLQLLLWRCIMKATQTRCGKIGMAVLHENFAEFGPWAVYLIYSVTDTDSIFIYYVDSACDDLVQSKWTLISVSALSPWVVSFLALIHGWLVVITDYGSDLLLALCLSPLLIHSPHFHASVGLAWWQWQGRMLVCRDHMSGLSCPLALRWVQPLRISFRDQRKEEGEVAVLLFLTSFLQSLKADCALPWKYLPSQGRITLQHCFPL